MKIQPVKEPFEHIIIDDMYTEEELSLIWRELNFLKPKMLKPEHTISARNKTTGEYKKRASGLFLDSVYNDRSFSDILTLNRKLFCEDIATVAKSFHPMMEFITICGVDRTLINHYDNGNYYETHNDIAVLTAVTFFTDDVGFTGGNFTFTDYDYLIEQKNNRVVIFPSVVNHSVSEVYVNKNGKGRFSMAQFLFVIN